MRKHHNSTICIGNMTSQHIKCRGDNFCEKNNKIYDCVEKTCGIYISRNPGATWAQKGDIYNTSAHTASEGTLPPNEQHLMNETEVRVLTNLKRRLIGSHPSHKIYTERRFTSQLTTARSEAGCHATLGGELFHLHLLEM